MDLIDYFIVSNHCVSDICVSEVISKYFKIPRLDFYVPYTNNKSSLKYFKLELLELKKRLESITGTEITNEKIFENINKYNEFKKVLLKVNELEIIGSEKLKILHRAMLYGPEFQPDLEKEKAVA